MIGIETPADRADAQTNEEPRLTLGEKLSYGAGEVASNLTWNMATGFLLLYYTDVALLPLSALGALMLVTRVLDALFDPIAGVLVDKTYSRFGKARPYLLFVPLPFAILAVLCFSVPEASPYLKVAYAYVTFTLLGLAFSLLYIPYGALLPMVARHEADRVQLGSFRAMGTSIGSIIVYALTLPIVAFAADRQGGFRLAAAVFGGVTVLLYWLVYARCRERTRPPATARASLRLSLKHLVRNPVWIVTMCFAFLIFIRIGVKVPITAYFAKDVLHRPELISVLLPLLSVSVLIGGYLSGPVIRRLGERYANIGALTFTILMYLVLPFTEREPMLFLIVFALANVMGGVQAATVFILTANAVDHQEARFGTRSEGLLVATTSFSMKFGMAIGTAITAWTLAFAGYRPDAAQPLAVNAIRVLVYVVPIVISLGQIACISFYRGRSMLSVHSNGTFKEGEPAGWAKERTTA